MNRTPRLLMTTFALLSMAAQADTPAAPQKGCIELKSVAEREETFVDAQGQQAVRRVPVNTVVPGTEVIWTLSAVNVCEQPADKVFIDNPVPEHMEFVGESARGSGAEISYSLDGRNFAAPTALTVKAEDGSVRQARADEYRHIRWTFRNAIGPGQLAAASFRARVR
jgi:hypothetical protein